MFVSLIFSQNKVSGSRTGHAYLHVLHSAKGPAEDRPAVLA